LQYGGLRFIVAEGLLAEQDFKKDNAHTPDIDLNTFLYHRKSLTLELIIGGLFDISKHSGA
jgi:hypothetical protein